MRDITAALTDAGVTEPRATAAVGWLTDTRPDDLIGYVVVGMRADLDGTAGLCVVSSLGTDRAAAAALLRHAATYMTGECRACRRRDRKARHANRK